ncbi:MAG: hypothetical protein ACP5VR_06425, partial [Acidimicrobiales bacterium]
MALSRASELPQQGGHDEERPGGLSSALLGQPAPAVPPPGSPAPRQPGPGHPSEPGDEAEQRAGPFAGGSEPSFAWLRTVSFRARISFLVAVAVGLAVVMAAAVAYVAVSRQLEGQVKTKLSDAVTIVSTRLIQIQPQLFGNGGILDTRPFVNFQLETGDPVQVLDNG